MLFNNWSHLSLKSIDWKLIILSGIEANYTLQKMSSQDTHILQNEEQLKYTSQATLS